MDLASIKLMFRYNNWTNHLLLNTAKNLTHAQLIKPNSSSWGSLFGTLFHTMHAEYIWLSIMQDGAFGEPLHENDFPSLDTLEIRWQEEMDAMQTYLNSLTDDNLHETISWEAQGSTRSNTLWHIFFHLINHGTQHRSEAAAMLTDFGFSPGSIDFRFFLASTNE